MFDESRGLYYIVPIIYNYYFYCLGPNGLIICSYNLLKTI